MKIPFGVLLSLGLLAYKIHAQAAQVPSTAAELGLGQDEARNKAILAPYVAQAASDYGVPERILSRLLERESDWRLDVINGSVISSAGAVGIAQIIPKWHEAVDPLNPVESIAYAAYYLAELKKQFGSWELAAAAYNWGPSNLATYGYSQAPTETKKYVAYIFA